jgi:hypothetical protein
VNPVYRIEVEHKPDSDDDSLPFVARVYDTDDWCIFAGWGGTAQLAFNKAQAWIKAQANSQIVGTYYTDEDGNLVESHSVKS